MANEEDSNKDQKGIGATEDPHMAKKKLENLAKVADEVRGKHGTLIAVALFVFTATFAVISATWGMAHWFNRRRPE